MAESVRELPGDPSYVLDCLAQRLAREGWTVGTRTGPLLQASRDGHFLSLTVLGSARGTLVHAEGSHSAVAYFRQAIGSEGVPPRHFSLAGPGRHLRAAVIAGLGLTATASLLLLSTFCQSRPSSDVTTAISGSAPTIANLAPALEGLAHTPVPPKATPVLPKPTPALASARARRPSPQPTASPAAPSVTPAPPEPTPTAWPAITSTATPRHSKPTPTRVAPGPTIDLSGLTYGVSH